MPPPRPTTVFFQSPHTLSLTSSPCPIRSTSTSNLTCHRHRGSLSTRPTRFQYDRLPARTRHSYPLHSRCFTTTPASYRDQNHYEVLDLPVTASAAEIKKKFYALSLRHHPDRNRTDPTASQRFARISSAYSVLSNPQKRATYDRDHGFHLHHHRTSPNTHHHAYPHGSHSSHSANAHKAGYAGSRPASGLSNRRGTYRGPPPSFYAQGGYGATGRSGEGFAGGKAGAGAGWGGGFENSTASTSSTGTSAGTRFGQKDGGGGKRENDPEDPMGFIDRNPLGHFNARGHYRTQKAEDDRRRERASRARTAAKEKADSFIAGGEFGLLRFVVVCGILMTAGAMTGLWRWPGTASATAEDGKTGKKRKDAVSAIS